MAHARPGGRARDRGRARVAEEVEHRDRAAGRADLRHGVVPVGGLLWEDARVLEVHGLDAESQLPITNVPALRESTFIPAAAAGMAAAVAPVGRAPARVGARRVPDGLGVRAHKGILAPALELFAARTVEHLKILPRIRNPHSCSSCPAAGTCSSSVRRNGDT